MMPIAAMRLRKSTGGGDPLWPFVVSCVNDFGAENSTDWVDERGHVWTPSGSARVVRSNPGFPDGAVTFDGASYLDGDASSDWNFGAGPFCIEAFVLVTAPASNRAIASFMSNWTWYVGGGGADYLYFYDGSSNVLSSDAAFPLGTAKHVALTRDADSNLRQFVDGVQAGPTAPWFNNVSSNNLRFGAATGGSPSSFFTGLIGRRRVTKGRPRYTGNFIPPAGPFPTTA